METPIAIAIIAAVASVLGAVLAGRSARQARRSAEVINSRNHQIAMLDRDAEELRAAYMMTVERVGTPAGRTHYLGAVVAACELLMACRAADDTLRQSAEALGDAVNANTADKLGEVMRELREAYSGCQ